MPSRKLFKYKLFSICNTTKTSNATLVFTIKASNDIQEGNNILYLNLSLFIVVLLAAKETVFHLI